MQDKKIIHLIPSVFFVIVLFLFGKELAETNVYGEMVGGIYVSYYKRFTTYDIIFGGQGLPSNSLLTFGFVVLIASIGINVYKFFSSTKIAHYVSIGTTVLSAIILNPFGYFSIFAEYNSSEILGPRLSITINNILFAIIVFLVLFGAAFIAVADYILERKSNSL